MRKAVETNFLVEKKISMDPNSKTNSRRNIDNVNVNPFRKASNVNVNAEVEGGGVNVNDNDNVNVNVNVRGRGISIGRGSMNDVTISRPVSTSIGVGSLRSSGSGSHPYVSRISASKSIISTTSDANRTGSRHTPTVTRTDADRERDREIRRRDREHKQRSEPFHVHNNPLLPPPSRIPPPHHSFDQAFAVVMPNHDALATPFDSTPTTLAKPPQIFQTLTLLSSNNDNVCPSFTSDPIANHTVPTDTTHTTHTTNTRSAKWLELTSSTPPIIEHIPPPALMPTETPRHPRNTSLNNSSTSQLSAAAALLTANFSEEHTHDFNTIKHTIPPTKLDDKISSSSSSTNNNENNPNTNTNPNPNANCCWALKVRILSAVDLPPNITPSSPLCPLVKFGLVFDPELAAECQTMLLRNTQQPTHTKQPRSTTSLPETTNNILAIKQYLNSDTCHEAHLSRTERLNGAVKQLGIAHMPFVHSNVRYTTAKLVLSKSDNGTAEFQEEIRWDGMTNPMAATLIIELCARAMPLLPGIHNTAPTPMQQQKPIGRSSSSRRNNSATAPDADTTAAAEEDATAASSTTTLLSAGWSSRSKIHASASSVCTSTYDDPNNSKATPAPVVDDSKALDSSSLPSTIRKNLLGQLWQRRSKGLVDSLTTGGGFNSTTERKLDVQESANAASAVAKLIKEAGKHQRIGGTKNATSTSNNDEAAAAAKPIKTKIAGSSTRRSSNSSDGSRRNSYGQNITRRRFENASAGWIERGSSSEVDEDDDDDDDDDDCSTDHENENSDNTGAFPSSNNNTDKSDVTSGTAASDQADDGNCNLVEDLRIASLTISLSRLPFDSEGKKATISRWYSMDSFGPVVAATTVPNPTTATVGGGTAATSSPSTTLTSTSSGTTATITSTAPMRSSDGNSIVMTHKRSPSILLELSFASTKDLDDSEDEVGGDEGGTLMWGDDEESSDKAFHGSEDEEDKDERSPKQQKQQRAAPLKQRAAPVKHDRTTTAVPMNTATAIGGGGTSSTTKSSRQKSGKRRSSIKTAEDPELEPGIVDYICIVGPKSIGSQRKDDGSKGWVESHPELCVLERFPKTDEFHAKNGRKYAILPNMVEWFCFPETCKLWRGTDPPTHFDLKPRSSSSNPSQTISAFDSCFKCASSFTWFVISSTGESYGAKQVKTYCAVIRFFAPAPFCIDPTQDDYAQFHTIMKDGGEHGGTANIATDVTGYAVPIDTVEDRSLGENMSAAKQCSWSLKRKRLWVPLAICLTSQLPIVGILEAMLLQLCETLSSKAKTAESFEGLLGQVHIEVANLIVNFSCPIPGVLHCSIPFLDGERLHVMQPPPTGLPPLPHGSCITAVCRLLGAEGLTTLLAAVLTECKIIIHSSDLSNLAMVAETVVGALIYPFTWALPYIPVLPEAMLEFVEAPLSFFLGVPTSVVKYIEKSVLKDIVVFDLDQAGSPDYFDGGRRDALETKHPTPLPAGMSSCITKGVFRLLRLEEEVEEQYYSKSGTFSESRRHSPRLEAESLAEREFRVSVARQVGGLMRGYQECLFFVSSNQPVFNRDRFLRNAPALFEQRRGSADVSGASGRISTVLSPRAKRFLSLLVNTQHFHQLLERLDHEHTSFFHEVIDTFESEESTDGAVSSADEAMRHLCETLQKLEDKIPTYRVDRFDTEQLGAVGTQMMASWEFQGQNSMPALDESEEDEVADVSFNFVQQLLLPITVPSGSNKTLASSSSSDVGMERGVKSLSVELLIELENNPWRYNGILGLPYEISKASDPNYARILEVLKVRRKIEVKKAIGERRYRVYKLMLQQKALKHEDSISVIDPSQENNPVDLSSLLSSVNELDLDGGATQVQLTKGSSEQALQDGKDRDAVRRCLERAYEGASQTRSTTQFNRRGSTGTESQQGGLTFLENGRDLIQEAEAALRNPNAQRFLVTVLSKRARFENQRRTRLPEASPRGGKSKNFRKSLDRISVSRLVPAAFECLVRLCCAMLEACIETQDYDAAYTLLTHTTGFCTVKQGNNADNIISDDIRRCDDQESQQNQVIYMTARIGMHPIFSDVRLWECVLHMHLQGRLQTSKDGSQPTTLQCDGDKSDTNEYEAAVATLYEMVAFGVPAEELARFATRVSEARGWFSSEKGQALLMLVRKLGIRRDDAGDALIPSGNGVIPSLSPDRGKTLESFITDQELSRDVASNIGAGVILDVAQMEWQELSWAHPTASVAGMSAFLSNSRRPLPSMLKHGGEDNFSDGVLEPIGYEGRSAIASLASFGASVVATGGVDGSVFLAHTLRFPDHFSSTGSKLSNTPSGEVRGVRVECGKDNGAVTCLAAAKGAGYKQTASSQTFSDEEESLSVLEGCRIVAGTTGGALRVWCIKDIYASTSIVNNAGDSSELVLSDAHGLDRDGQYIRSGQQSIANKLKWSLKGRALSGHRGGVTCLDVPSPIYRPDSLVSGGADGLIKLWSLRHVTRRSARAGSEMPTSRFLGRNDADKRASSNDALETLPGHAGRVLCIKTAWHGDRMLSGGADKTVRLWDLSSTGKCLQTLHGHSCWVTHTHYWGQNNIVSASTDRSIALWDVRGGKLPLFVLRYHKSPVSDLLMGSRNDPLLVSASGDGTIATWDFRSLSSSNDPKASAKSKVHTSRTPAAKMNHCLDLMSNTCCGTILLARGTGLHERSVLSAGIDGRLKEWDIQSGKLFDDRFTRHTDAISCLSTFTESDGLRRGKTGSSASVGGTITCSWDGTVRVKRLLLKDSSDG